MFQIVPEERGHGSSTSINKDAGTIVIKIKRIRRLASRPSNDFRSPPSHVTGNRPGDAYVGYGVNSPTTPQSETTWDVGPYDDDGSGSKRAKTYVSFVFRYRTMEFLQAQGIVDSAPAAPPRPSVPRRITAHSLSQTAEPPRRAVSARQHPDPRYPGEAILDFEEDPFIHNQYNQYNHGSSSYN
ncbi:hypothetical protein K435DRAFT_934272 [Dendrothele bispora CBS 962.96]|uniref:Uncharacterized protein n=1 Tax=Dendrothele bispora (strain CBS 962.96) TaxID=1314807 RepID=A0A4S8L1P7_DENBC|nr:hypothetical protein K435DRAFT_934272 [Dendrothele bispora CBS 962.96]